MLRKFVCFFTKLAQNVEDMRAYSKLCELSLVDSPLAWLHCVRSMDFFLEKILEIHSYFSMRITLDRKEGGCNHSLCISEDKDETSTT